MGVPITVEGELWGLIAVVSTSDEPPPPGTEERLAGFTELVATAIANAQAREELGTIADEQASLRRVATSGRGRSAAARRLHGSGGGGGPPALCRGRVRGPLRARRRRNHSRCEVTSDRPAPDRSANADHRAEPGLVVRDTERPARIDHYADHPVALQYGIESSAAAPITVQGRLWGYIGVTSSRDEPPPGTEVRLAAFTEIAATAIANAQARIELRGYAEEQAALRRVATLVAQGVPPEDAIRRGN